MPKIEVILVDRKDNKIGIEEKLKAHKEGKLHRSFSIFIFNKKGGVYDAGGFCVDGIVGGIFQCGVRAGV